MTVRLMIVDDDPLVRAGLSLILGGDLELAVSGEASDGQEAVDRHRDDPVDVVLMDLRMPVLDGIAATAELKRLPQPPAVIVLTTFDADDHVIRALAVGADGFLLKDTPPADIVTAIKDVVAGHPALSPAITALLIDKVVRQTDGERRDGAGELVATLTDRELEVATALARGASNAEVAEKLFMSLATVKAHISRIFAKLGANNRVQVAICMHDAGLV
ncbi:response regulator transcription factor [Rhodococcus triatomae]|nr:response regulator receiver [Rhodococcus triatomae BKS 15-14]